MPIIRVNVFRGVKEQVPQQYDVDALTYGDAIQELVHHPMPTGYMYGVNGETIIAKDPINLKEVNYIIPDGDFNYVNVITVFGEKFTVIYPIYDKVSYILQQAQYKNPTISKLILNGENLEPSQPAYRYNLTPHIKLHAM